MPIRRHHLLGPCVRLASALAACWFMVAPSRAADTALRLEPPALPLSCLTSASSESLAYPPTMTGQESAVLRVEMEFVSNDAGPKVRLQANSGDPAFEPTVLAHVAGYRLPCLEPGRSMSAVQEIQFVGSNPGDPRVLASEARYSTIETWATQGCTVDGLGVAPVYPREALQTRRAGTVVVAVKFLAADAAPEIKVLFDGGYESLAASVRKVVEGYRLRCREPLAHAYLARQRFAFQIDGGSFPQLKEKLTLPQLIGAMEGLQKAKVRFDLTTMGCPFDLAFSPYRPYADNGVEADLRNHPERREFVEWLQKIVMALPVATMRTAIGSTSTVTVPCAVLDLT